jgi:hypothetical protein
VREMNFFVFVAVLTMVTSYPAVYIITVRSLISLVTIVVLTFDNRFFQLHSRGG